MTQRAVTVSTLARLMLVLALLKDRHRASKCDEK